MADHPNRAGTDQWWWLEGGAWAQVTDRSNGGLYTEVVDWFGGLKTVSDAEVESWGVAWEMDLDVSWWK